MLHLQHNTCINEIHWEPFLCQYNYNQLYNLIYRKVVLEMKHFQITFQCVNRYLEGQVVSTHCTTHFCLALCT